jgi:hypothetical protein
VKPKITLFIGALLSLAGPAWGQDTATLSVVASDPSGAAIPDARVTLIATRRGLVHQVQTPRTGMVTFDHLDAGPYALDVEKTGFNKIHMEQIVIAIRDRQTLHVEMKVAPAAQITITVTGQTEGVSADPAAGISMDSTFTEHLPINGRSPQSLILMTPGITSAAGGRGGMGFNTNGLRDNMNYYTLDGVSLNAGVGGGGGGGGGGGPMGGGGMGGGPPMGGGGGGGMGGGGGGPEMISIDAMQEMRVQTSSFAPEFGRSPGAQISMTSRGGGNGYHGSVFAYLRNDRFDANDWFANSIGEARGKLRQTRPGGVFGGPVRKNRTFFFTSVDALRLTAPSTVIASVPDLASRKAAKPALRPYLNAFPLPNGSELTDGAAQFRAVISNPSRSDNGSIRADHVINERWNLFARYSQSRSSGDGRGSEMVTPNVISSRENTSQTATTGLTRAVAGGGVNDLRVNYSASTMKSSSFMDTFGGAVPLAEARMFPTGISSATGQFSLSISGLASYSYATAGDSVQRQINVVDSYTQLAGAHHFKAGVDARYIIPTYYRKPYSQSVTFRSLGSGTDSLLNGVATNVNITGNTAAVYPKYQNFSAYAQDTWRATDRTTLTYGLRWDVNPAPGVRSGPRPFAVASSDIAGVTQNDPLYQTRWLDVAPRVGLAYQIDTTEGREIMFRAGAGMFYDVGYGMSAGAFSGAPYSSVRTLTSVTFPVTGLDLTSPSLPPTRPYGQIVAADTDLQAPRVFQYGAAVERMFGPGQSLTVGYTGTKGDRLLRTEMQPSYSDAYDLLSKSTNGASSDYNGLQVQFRKRLSTALQTQLSYTWAHSIDSASSDMGGGFATLYGDSERGSSDYDIRHSITFSGSWRLPAPRKGLISPVVYGWFIDFVATARTGLPFDVMNISTSASNASDSSVRGGIFARVRPDYTGATMWLSDVNVPGGRRLNPGAFSTPEDGYSQGNLGRNALRGFDSKQADISLRRQFAVGERWRLNLSAEAFNAFNYPNFANPSSDEGANLASPKFGIMTRMANQSMGGASTVYRSGGSRSMELALRFSF